MDAPEAPERSAIPSLYGDGNGCINRRALIFAASATFALPARARNAIAPAADPVARARTAMGGDSLARVRTIGWSGAARLFAPGRAIDLHVETRIEPFVRARSESWLAADDRSAKRTLMVEGHGAFAVIEGKQIPLAPAQAEYERQQFGIYGHMLLAGIALARGNGFASAKAGYPEAWFTLARGGMLATADYLVDAPDTAATIRERLSFSGSVTDQGINWPRHIAITQNGKPFYDLTIDELTVELAPA
jgi:hypothetical protein